MKLLFRAGRGRRDSPGDPFGGACDLTGDKLVNLVLEVFCRDSDCVGDSAFTGRPMSLEDYAIETQERGTAIYFRIHTTTNRLERVLGQ